MKRGNGQLTGWDALTTALGSFAVAFAATYLAGPIGLVLALPMAMTGLFLLMPWLLPLATFTTIFVGLITLFH